MEEFKQDHIDDGDTPSDKLTDKQKVFCAEYMTNGYNGYKAALSAGYTQFTSLANKATILESIKVQGEIDRRMKRLLRRYDITEDRILQEVANLAFLDVLDIYNPDGSPKQLDEMSESARRAINGVESEQFTEGKGSEAKTAATIKRFKVSEKKPCLELLMKWKAMLVDTKKVEHSGAVDHKVQASDLEERLAQLTGTVEELPVKISDKLSSLLK